MTAKKGRCAHNDGWIIYDEPVLDVGETVIVRCRCNHMGCNENRLFKVECVKEIGKLGDEEQ